MSSDRDKLLAVMSSLEADYKAGKISAEKYSYFRSKYEDKLNAIDAKDATKRIRSMQGKPQAASTLERRSEKPTRNRKDEKQDLVQKYIINPKKDDAKYNKKKKAPMDSGTFKLLLLLVLVLGFTVGVGYGVFSFDFDSISETNSVAIVKDTAFPDIIHNITANTTSVDTYEYVVENTTDTSQQDYVPDSSVDPVNPDSGGGQDSGDGQDDGGGSPT